MVATSFDPDDGLDFEDDDENDFDGGLSSSLAYFLAYVRYCTLYNFMNVCLSLCIYLGLN